MHGGDAKQTFESRELAKQKTKKTDQCKRNAQRTPEVPDTLATAPDVSLVGGPIVKQRSDFATPRCAVSTHRDTMDSSKRSGRATPTFTVAGGGCVTVAGPVGKVSASPVDNGMDNDNNCCCCCEGDGFRGGGGAPGRSTR
jgi:hypothetical protein